LIISFHSRPRIVPRSIDKTAQVVSFPQFGNRSLTPSDLIECLNFRPKECPMSYETVAQEDDIAPFRREIPDPKDVITGELAQSGDWIVAKSPLSVATVLPRIKTSALRLPVRLFSLSTIETSPDRLPENCCGSSKREPHT
jgi:hypothetical protein